ncbi:hypothetical protein NQ318_017241 [Aromia moschata]|uniref:Integrase p58-like C-terminal domain-containing protein n=1 Tax=Aromia moschata TaxID=1265417 RepID=A0AAV8YKJ8_9CUCU|nr:hypothetical protein NQ318_017241 [Aromia moschata]
MEGLSDVLEMLKVMQEGITQQLEGMKNAQEEVKMVMGKRLDDIKSAQENISRQSDNMKVEVNEVVDKLKSEMDTKLEAIQKNMEENVAETIVKDRIETIEDYSSNLAARLDSIHNEVRKKMTFESNRSKTRGLARANTEGFHEDDEVWLYNPARKKGRCPKLQKSWEGPYKIIKRLKDVVYMIQRGPRAKMKVVHLDRLAPYSRANEEE